MNAWPTCPNCGRRAPHETKEHQRDLTAGELELAKQLRERREAGEQLRGLNVQLANSGIRQTAAGWVGVLRWREILKSPRPHWGYPSGVEDLPFCTLRCSTEFAGKALRAGYRIAKRGA